MAPRSLEHGAPLSRWPEFFGVCVTLSSGSLVQILEPKHAIPKTAAETIGIDVYCILA